jgi:hypothetical protein
MVGNKVDDENELAVSFRSRNNIQMMQVPAPSISLVALFKTLADEDIYQAADMPEALLTNPRERLRCLQLQVRHLRRRRENQALTANVEMRADLIADVNRKWQSAMTLY